MFLAVRNCSKNNVLARRTRVCESFPSRLRGLLGRPRLAADEACLIRPCRGVHTFGMRYPIDVVFLDANQRVISITRGLKPNRVTRLQPKARSALEMASLPDLDCRIGDRLALEPGTGLGQRGQSYVEMALLLPLLLMLFAVVIDTGLALYNQQALGVVARIAGRYASTGKIAAGDPDRETSIRAVATLSAKQVLIAAPTTTFYDSTGLNQAGLPSTPLRVTESNTFTVNFMTALLCNAAGIPTTYAMSAETTVLNEPFV